MAVTQFDYAFLRLIMKILSFMREPDIISFIRKAKKLILRKFNVYRYLFCI